MDAAKDVVIKKKKKSCHKKAGFLFQDNEWENYFVNLKNSKNIPWEYKDIKYSTYEEALISVLQPLLNIIK